MRVAVTWEMCGFVDIDAVSMEEAAEEFNDPTPLSEDRNWKLEIVLPCRQGIRTKSMTELLFCMLRSGC